MFKCLNDYKWVLVFAVLVALAAGIFAWRQDDYSVSLALKIVRSTVQNAADYKYDNYYALKAGDEFGSAVVGWFKTPEMAQAIYKQAGLDSGQAGLGSLARRFQAAKISPATVEVRFGASGVDEAKKISQAAASAAAAQANLLSVASKESVAFAVIGGEPIIISNAGNLWRDVLIGFLIGLVFGFFGKIAKEYFNV